MDYNSPPQTFLLALDIHSLLPQQEPFVMVDRLIGFGPDYTVTETTVGTTGLFINNGQLSTAGLLENMAQTCAARIGYVNRFILRRGLQAGVVGSVSEMTVKHHPMVGELMTTRLEVVTQLTDMMLGEVSVSVHDRPIATARLRMALSPHELNNTTR